MYMSKNDRVDAFIRNECFLPRGLRERCKAAERGENPCEKCEKKSCNTQFCRAYYIYFSLRWQKLQRRLLRT